MVFDGKPANTPAALESDNENNEKMQEVTRKNKRKLKDSSEKQPNLKKKEEPINC